MVLLWLTPLPYREFVSLIGREIVQALPGGEERTGYGGRQLCELSDIAAAAVRAGVLGNQPEILSTVLPGLREP